MNNKLTLPHGVDAGEISDGYHTFDELYEHRCILFLALMQCNSAISWASKLHEDGTMFEGYFIAGMNISKGTITYHLPIKLWDSIGMSDIEILDKALPWDGHSPNDVVDRLSEWCGVGEPLGG